MSSFKLSSCVLNSFQCKFLSAVIPRTACYIEIKLIKAYHSEMWSVKIVDEINAPRSLFALKF